MMRNILNRLFEHTLEIDSETLLMEDEDQKYRDAAHAEAELEQQLERLLEGECARLFQQYVNRGRTAGYWSDVSSFRNGLAMGMKLGTFFLSRQ